MNSYLFIGLLGYNKISLVREDHCITNIVKLAVFCRYPRNSLRTQKDFKVILNALFSSTSVSHIALVLFYHAIFFTYQMLTSGINNLDFVQYLHKLADFTDSVNDILT